MAPDGSLTSLTCVWSDGSVSGNELADVLLRPDRRQRVTDGGAQSRSRRNGRRRCGFRVIDAGRWLCRLRRLLSALGGEQLGCRRGAGRGSRVFRPALELLFAAAAAALEPVRRPAVLLPEAGCWRLRVRLRGRRKTERRHLPPKAHV